MHSVQIILFCLCLSLVNGGRSHRAECSMWSRLENKTLPLQNQGHAKCVTNPECTGFSCKGIYQGKDISFGMRVLPCQTPPGAEIFGYAPQYNAKNFSHIFTHKAEYEVPGALLNISMLPDDGVKPGAESLIKGMLEVHLKMNHDENTLTLGLNAKACINRTCFFSKPLFNNSEIPVPDCPNAIPTSNLDIKAYSTCKLTDIASCGKNQVCEQQESGSNVGTCACLPGYSIQDDNSCLSVQEEEEQLSKEQINRPKKSTASLPAADIPRASSSPVGSPSAAIPQQAEDTNGGAIAAVVISLLAVIVVLGVGIGIVMRTRIGTRLRARLTNTPYGDIHIGTAPGTSGAHQMMGSTTTLESEAASRNAFA